MPKRTNQFQQLIYMIQKQLAGKAKVTESRLLIDRLTGDESEVDVVIERKVAGFKLVIGLECTSRKRPATIEWVREMIGKHDSLPVDKTILVSQAGFSKSARSRAESEGITTLTIEAATNVDWAKSLGNLDQLVLGAFELTPHAGRVIYDNPRAQMPTQAQSQNSLLRNSSWEPPITLSQFSIGLAQDLRMAKEIKNRASPKVGGKTKRFEITAHWSPNELTEINLGSKVWTPVRKISVKYSVALTTAPLRLVEGKLQDSHVAYGTTANILSDSASPEKDVMVTIVETEDGLKGGLMVPEFDNQKYAYFEFKSITGAKHSDQEVDPS